MKNRNLEHSGHWKTPDWLYNALNSIYDFDFDPCPLHCEVDNLAPDAKWGERNFVNPEYDLETKEAFVERAVGEFWNNGNRSFFLIPASINSVLFHSVIWENATRILIPNCRINFEGYNTKGEYVKKNTGQTDLMFVEFWYMYHRMDNRPQVGTIDIKKWRPKKSRKNAK
jgi:hypothetical protein